MSNKNKNLKKQNLPNYITNKPKDLLEIQKEYIEENEEKQHSKFKLGIDKNGCPIITIDGIFHCFNPNQFNAFTLGIINIAKKINPEIDYSRIFEV